MINYVCDYHYIDSNEAKLFTAVLLPDVDAFENEKEESIASTYLNEQKKQLEHGYAVVIRYCRGGGKRNYVPKWEKR